MIRLDTSALTKLGTAISDILTKVANTAIDDESRIGQVISTGVSRHFRRQEMGGADSDAIGGSFWPTHRRKETLAVRKHISKIFGLGKGYSRFPLLSIGPSPGPIERAFRLPSAITTSSKRGGGSMLFYFSLDQKQAKKGESNQFGGPGMAIFFNRIKSHNFPERPFLYWDRHMSNSVVAMAKQRFEREAAKRKVIT